MINPLEVWRVYKRYTARQKELDNIAAEFNDLNFSDGRYDGCTNILGDPLRDVGVAIRLAKKYKIEFHIGMSYGDCRAVISKDNWEHPINPHSDFRRGRFRVDEPIDEIQDIVAFGFTINEAVCKCLILAKNAGVI